MNQIISDLYEKACDIERENEIATTSYRDRTIIKFAELIVQECAHLADDWVNNTDNGKNYPSEVLKKHFGVKE